MILMGAMLRNFDGALDVWRRNMTSTLVWMSSRASDEMGNLEDRIVRIYVGGKWSLVDTSAGEGSIDHR